MMANAHRVNGRISEHTLIGHLSGQVTTVPTNALPISMGLSLASTFGLALHLWALAVRGQASLADMRTPSKARV